jgi:hypothetical protein
LPFAGLEGDVVLTKKPAQPLLNLRAGLVASGRPARGEADAYPRAHTNREPEPEAKSPFHLLRPPTKEGLTPIVVGSLFA